MDEPAVTSPAAPAAPSLARHLLLPALAPALLLLVAATPVGLLGCRGRGLLAFGIALASALASLAAALAALRGRWRGEAGHGRWILTALVLALPAVLLLWLA